MERQRRVDANNYDILIFLKGLLMFHTWPIFLSQIYPKNHNLVMFLLLKMLYFPYCVAKALWAPSVSCTFALHLVYLWVFLRGTCRFIMRLVGAVKPHAFEKSQSHQMITKKFCSCLFRNFNRSSVYLVFNQWHILKKHYSRYGLNQSNIWKDANLLRYMF